MPPPASSPVAEQPAAPPGRRSFLVALTGNPNCGKTTLFNALTGLRARVGNYAGVTVERKEGPLQGAPPDRPVTILDLPGTYSLSPQSLDEQIVRDVLLARLPEVRPPDLVVVVVDASNLERNLYYATQVLELGYPTLIALNMVDVARDNGLEVDAGKLAQTLGVPVFPLVASTREGVPALRAEILRHASRLAGSLAARPGRKRCYFSQTSATCRTTPASTIRAWRPPCSPPASASRRRGWTGARWPSRPGTNAPAPCTTPR